MKIRKIGLYTKILGEYRKVITISETAEIIGVSRQSILKDYVNRGVLPAVRIGGLAGGDLFLIPLVEVRKLKNKLKGGE